MAKPKTIRRASHDKDNPYFMMHRTTAQDRTLSYEAVGMLSYILSRPDDWEVQPDDLQRDSCGRDKVYRIIRELIKARYMVRERILDDKKRIVKFQYATYERPLPEKPDLENQDITYKREEQNTESQSTENTLSNAPIGGSTDVPQVVAFQDVRQHWHSVIRTWDTPNNMVYIGRANVTHNLPESIWHNPYRIDINGTREEVIAKYKADLLRNRDLLLLISELRGKTLVCWCKPEACHGDVLAELAALPDTELQALIDAATPKAKRTDILRDKLYKHLDDGRYEGPYGPYSNTVKAGGAFVQGEVLPPDAVIVAPTRSRDLLFDAIATHVLGAKDNAAISAVGWRVGQILYGDKRTNRCKGLLAYECERQGKTEIDPHALADDVPLFWKDFKQNHPDLELKDCAKVMEYWVKWRGKVAATPIQVSFIEHDDWVAPSEVK